jgi:hypothetical protein
MKKYIIILFVLLFTNKTFSQDITGNWNWSYLDKHKSEITLVKINTNEYKGYFCSSYNKGEKIDCYFEDNEYSIFITKTNPNIFEGSFRSNFSNKLGTLKIEYILATGKIKLSIITKPDGEYYLPNNVYFEK